MSANSKIQWTNKTWNPIAAFLKRDISVEVGGKKRVIPKGTRGWFCVKVSPGCANCYAEAINLRLGNGLTYLHRNLDDIEFRLVNLEDPLKWKKPCMVFVNSMTDLFLEHIPDEMILDVYKVMEKASMHTFQILTKRHHRMSEWFEGCDNPLPNVWLGVSVEDQIRAEQRIPILLQTPAAVHFLSCEPLLGAIDNVILTSRHYRGDTYSGRLVDVDIDWVIVGGESGPKARPCNIDWILSIVTQCKAAEVPVFVKQLGAHPIQDIPRNAAGWETFPAQLRDKKGGDMFEWPEALRIREFPKTAA